MAKTRKDKIVKIEIDVSGKLHIKPEFEKFSLIYRTASEVHWDENHQTLISPKPKDWNYIDWFKHIVKVVETDCFVEISISETTNWVNVPEEIREEIMKA